MKLMLRVLLIEEDALVALPLAETVQSLDHDVRAISGPESVAQALKYQPDLLVVDVELGNGASLSAVQAIVGTRFVPQLFVTW